MRIQSVKLRNIGPFVSRQFDFDGSMIGITGANGAGKSTLFEAVYSAITGDFRKHLSLADFVHDEPSRQKSSSGTITVSFRHGRVEASVRRTIAVSKRRDGGFKGTQTAALRITTPSGEEEITGVEAVNQRIESLIGLDPATLGECAFIKQDAITGIVTMDNASRTRALHRLFGLTRYETVWNVLGAEINAIPTIQSAESVDDIRKELTAEEVELQRTAAEIRRLDGLLVDMAVEKAESAVAMWERAGVLRERVAAATTLVDESTRRARAAAAMRDARRAEASDLQVQLDKLKPAFDAAASALRRVDACMKLRGKLEQIELDMRKVVQRGARLSRPVAPVEQWTDNDEAVFREMQAQSALSEAFVREHEAFVTAGAESPVCPTCRQPVTNIAEQIVRHQAILADVRPKLSAMSQRRVSLTNAYDAYSKLLSQFECDVKSVRDDANHLMLNQKQTNEELETLGAMSEAEIAAHRNCIDEYNGLCGAVKSLSAVLNDADDVVITAESEAKTATTALDALRVELAAVDTNLSALTPDAIRSFQATIQLASNYRLELVRLRESERNRKLNVTQIAARLSRAEALMDRVARVERVRGILSSARDLFHRDQLPMVMARQFLSVINERMTHFLALMQADFTAELSQTDGVYALTCLFVNGTERSAFNLSGGEKVKFSVAFLLAVNEALAPQLGMLMLDEPTAALSESSVQQLMGPLGEVRSFAENAGVQVIIVTHSRQLVGCFDRTVDLSAVEDQERDDVEKTSQAA